MKKRLLFICWDGPQVNYLEGLFLPIFSGLKKDYQIYFLQFSWANVEKVSHLKSVCETEGITYEHFPIQRKPNPLIGSIFTLYKGSRFLDKFIQRHGINVIMPRSTFPAVMALSALRNRNSLQIVFDADGLPLEERVDFSGLNPRGIQYKILKSAESKAIDRADLVITRTNKAIDYLVKGKPELKHKFSVVSNGRDINFFKNNGQKEAIRNALGIGNDALIIVYAGSLGPQYCVEEMLWLHNQIRGLNPDTYLLILTGSADYLNRSEFKDKVDSNIIIKSVPFIEMPAYLAAADIGLAIRKPTLSMKGVAPIKIGEYLLSGLPVVASSGIGDTDEVLNGENSCFVLKDHEEDCLKAAADWIIKVYAMHRIKEEARVLGLKGFSLEKSIESYKLALSRIN